MHDIQDLDGRGVAGVMIATEAFKEAAAAQMDQLGFEASIVWIPHPVQNRNDTELHALADDVFADVFERLTA